MHQRGTGKLGPKQIVTPLIKIIQAVLLIRKLIYFRGDDQLTEAENFIIDEIAPIGDEYFDDGVGNMDFAYGSVMYFSAWVLR